MGTRSLKTRDLILKSGYTLRSIRVRRPQQHDHVDGLQCVIDLAGDRIAGPDLPLVKPDVGSADPHLGAELRGKAS